MFKFISVIFIILCLIKSLSYSGDHIFIEGEEKEKIQSAMMEYVKSKVSKNQNTYKIGQVKGVFDHLHKNVVDKDGFYASCSQVNAGDNIFIVDFYVKKESGQYIVVKEVLNKENDEVVNKLLWEKEQ